MYVSELLIKTRNYTINGGSQYEIYFDVGFDYRTATIARGNNV